MVNKMKELRESHGYTQVQFAKLLDVSRSCVQKWEKGETTPNKKNVRDIKLSFPTLEEVDKLFTGEEIVLDPESVDMLGIHFNSDGISPIDQLQEILDRR